MNYLRSHTSASERLFTRRQTLLLGLGGLTGLGASTLAHQFMNPSFNLTQPTLNPPTLNNFNFASLGNTPLRQRAANKGLIYGAAVRQYAVSSDTQFAQAVVRECAMIVPEWELKWNFLRPTPSTFDFGPADWLFNFAQTNGLLFRGHTLIWHEVGALPQWFGSVVNFRNARQLFLDHITTVVNHYRGRIHSWDVVNEAIHIPDGRSNGLRNTPWLNWLGEDYINLAFRTAAQADPNAMLVYNDYGLDYDTPQDEAKRNAVLRLLERLKAQGTPIHALGIQAHLIGGETRFNAQKLRNFLTEVANLGLKILITEIDVTDNQLPINIQARDQTVAGVYQDYLATVLNERAVVAVLNWGLSDRYTWLTEFAARSDQAPVRPLPLDDQMQRKLAWNAMSNAFNNAPLR
ncbi:endo-1,4-beta-xylanase [Nodularia chucula]|uniref:endo-1,4-beta-xylanase n=1 Tax=Nodularia chucula TaxID=3093667 RepID=UPI0039C67163